MVMMVGVVRIVGEVRVVRVVGVLSQDGHTISGTLFCAK